MCHRVLDHLMWHGVHLAHRMCHRSILITSCVLLHANLQRALQVGKYASRPSVCQRVTRVGMCVWNVRVLNTQLSPCMRLRCAQTLPQTALCVWVLCVWVLWGNRLPRPISSLVRVPHFGQSARRGQATCAAQCGSCCCANCRHADPAAQELAHGQGPHMCVCSVCVRECMRRQGAGCSRLQVPALRCPHPRKEPLKWPGQQAIPPLGRGTRAEGRGGWGSMGRVPWRNN